MALFSWSRTEFLQAYPHFQDKEEKGLFCRFDPSDRLIEAAFYDQSEILGQPIKYKWVEITNESLVEHSQYYTQEWDGSHGIHRYQGYPDGMWFEKKWHRADKLKEIIEDLIQTAKWARDGSLYDGHEAVTLTQQLLESYFAKSQFERWPPQLTEKRLLAWHEFNHWLLPRDYQLFFNSLDEKHTLLNEDELSAALTKWINGLKREPGFNDRSPPTETDCQQWLAACHKNLPASIREYLREFFFEHFAPLKL